MLKRKILKFVFITDTHHTGRNPQSRMDNLFDTSILKLQEVHKIVEEEDIRTILLHGGDVFDSPDISDNIAGIVGDIYKKFPEVYAISGNHDVRGNNFSTLSQTKLGLLSKLGIMKILDPYETIKFEDEETGVTVQLSGSSSDFGIINDLDKFIVKDKTCDIAIHLVHAMLVTQKMSFGSYVPLKSIQNDTQADITLCGDYHIGFEPYEYDKKVFLNPGALVRKSSSLEEMNRHPQVVVINVYEDKTFDYEYRKLEVAKPSQDVLDRYIIEKTIVYNDRLEEFKKGFNIDVKEKSFNTNIKEIVEELAVESKLPPEILKIALEKIDDAKTLLKL